MIDNKSILYVDDEPTNLMLFKFNFQKKYKILTALSGKEGLALLRSNPEVVLVISDMRMPEMNGLEFIKVAKEEYPSLVFFLLTGFDFTPEIREAMSNGLLQKYISKPFKIAEMEDSINQVLIS
jgi:response regulator RpfG family c-di-GMP phosphodiesterase